LVLVLVGKNDASFELVLENLGIGPLGNAIKGRQKKEYACLFIYW
jgi:hypothetical protein